MGRHTDAKAERPTRASTTNCLALIFLPLFSGAFSVFSLWRAFLFGAIGSFGSFLVGSFGSFGSFLVGSFGSFGSFLIGSFGSFGSFLVGSFGSFGSFLICLLYTSPSPRDGLLSRMPSSA